MIALDTPTMVLQAALASATGTTEPVAQVVAKTVPQATKATFEDYQSRLTRTVLTGATPVTICAAPEQNSFKAVEYIGVVNRSTETEIVSISTWNGTLRHELITASLTTNQGLFYESHRGWYVAISDTAGGGTGPAGPPGPEGPQGPAGPLGPPGSVNAIINGDMMIWQRGTSWVAPTNIVSADRWRYVVGGSARHTVAQHTSVPSVAQAGRLFTYNLLTNCTTAMPSVAANSFVVVSQVIEGYNWVPCAQRACTLSFWVQATKTGVYCISLASSNGDRSFVAEYTVSVTGVWEFKVIAIPPSPSAGTWNYTNGAGLHVRFALACGSDYRTTPGSWVTGNFQATANQVNACDAVNNYFLLTGVDLRPGTFTAPQFVSRSFGEELALCQRYYEKSYAIADAPGTIVTSGAHYGRYTGSASEIVTIPFAVNKRAAPTITTYNPDNGATGSWRDLSAAANRAVVVPLTSEGRCSVDVAASAAANTLMGHWTAEAEL